MKKIIIFYLITIFNLNINNLFSFFDNDICFNIENNKKICQKDNNYSLNRYYIKKNFSNDIIFPKNEKEYNNFKSLFKKELERETEKLSNEFKNIEIKDKKKLLINLILQIILLDFKIMFFNFDKKIKIKIKI